MAQGRGILTRASLSIGLCSLALALAAWWWPTSQTWWRLTPISIESWRENLRMLAVDRNEPDPRVDLSDRAFAKRALPQPWIAVSGEAWGRLLRTARESASLPTDRLPPDWRQRVHQSEADGAVTFYFGADEPPFSTEPAFSKLDAEVAFLHEPGRASSFFELARVVPGEGAGHLSAWQFRTSRWRLPETAAHPARGASLALFLLAALALLLAPLLAALVDLGRTEPGPQESSLAHGPETTLVNTRKRLVVGAFVASGLGVGLLLLPPALGIRGFDGGFAIQLVALLVTLSGLATGAVFWSSAERMGRLLSGQDLIARWQYSAAEWQSFVASEGPRMLSESRDLFRLVLSLSLVIGVGFVAVLRDRASVTVFVVLMSFMAFLKLVSVVAPRSRVRRLDRDPGLVLIGVSGLYRAGEFHDWAVPSSSLEEARLEETPEGPLLSVRYRFVTRYGFDTATVRVPVPGADRSEGQRVAEALSGRSRRHEP